MKLEEGDAFERTHSGWLRQEFPLYEPIWSLFIGHSGDGWPLPMPGLNPEEEGRRKKFFQSHYTAAVACFQVERLLGAIEAKLGEVKDIESFLREDQLLHSMMGRIGQVRDMYKQMDEALNLKGTAVGPLQDFYAQRSHVMHGPRMPVRIVDGLIQIPLVAKQNKQAVEWDDKSYWEDFKDVEFVFVADFCRRTRDNLFALVRDLHGKVHAGAHAFFGSRRVSEPVRISHGFLSSSTAFPAISSWAPPSGQFKL